MMRYIIIAISLIGTFLVAVFSLFFCNGCMAIVITGEHGALYQHNQNASNMVVNQDIPVTAQMARELTGIAGAQFKNNTASVNTNIKGIGYKK